MSDDFSRGLVQMSETLLLMAEDFKANATPEQCEQLASLCVEFAAVVKSLAQRADTTPLPVASAEPGPDGVSDGPARASTEDEERIPTTAILLATPGHNAVINLADIPEDV